jgi:hypothetical protein
VGAEMHKKINNKYIHKKRKDNYESGFKANTHTHDTTSKYFLPCFQFRAGGEAGVVENLALSSNPLLEKKKNKKIS